MSNLPQQAAALICAIADTDDRAARLTLHGLSKGDLRELAIWLARHVDPDRPFIPRFSERTSATEDCVKLAAARFGTTVEIVKGPSRFREHIEPRHVAAYAARLCGASYPTIGRALGGRDHTTAINAVARVGENARLRAIGTQIADAVGRHEAPEEEVA